MRYVALLAVMLVAATGATAETPLAACRPAPVQSPFDLPSGEEFDLHSTWIDAANGGDRSAVELLREHYATTRSLEERDRIGGALLRRVPDDAQIWSELMAHAEVCVRFPRADEEHSDAFVKWCEERAVDPEDYWWMSFNALSVASADPRSRPLLMLALETGDASLVEAGIGGLASQRAEAALPAIERALERFRESAPWLAGSLFEFHSERADELAYRYLDERSRNKYAADRAERKQ